MMIRSINFVRRLFEHGNVCVTGLRGTGKDLIFGNVINVRKQAYVSNLDYGGKRYEFKYADFMIGNNTYDTMLNQPLYYEYPFELGSDLYLSDVGVYFPSQYCNELNKRYQSFPYYMALSRQVSHNNVHINVQNLNRAWDKIREQSDIYIRCVKSYYVFGLVLQKIVVYDKYESCLNRVDPCRIKIPLLGDKDRILNAQIAVDKFANQYGSVKSYWLVYINRSKHDTYYFEKLLKEGVNVEKNSKS